MPSAPKIHYALGGKTLCGHDAITYDVAGKMVRSLKVSRHPDLVTCQRCRYSPHLDWNHRDFWM